jgi:hypothetical protein
LDEQVPGRAELEPSALFLLLFTIFHVQKERRRRRSLKVSSSSTFSNSCCHAICRRIPTVDGKEEKLFPPSTLLFLFFTLLLPRK